MLGKLLKQELKTQGKTASLMYIALAAATLLTMAVYGISRLFLEKGLDVIFVAVCAIYGITLVVTVVVNFISLCFHFYQSMYSAQGYLTHTLPVKATQILHVKVAVAFGYLCMTGICCIVSTVVIGMLVDGTGVGAFLDKAAQAVGVISQELGVSGVFYVSFLLVLFLLAFLNGLLLVFAGSSIGQLFHRSKAAYGIAATIGLYYASQIISLVVMFLGYLLYRKLFDPAAVPAAWAMGASILLLFGWVAVYYTICRVIVQKHINLE